LGKGLVLTAAHVVGSAAHTKPHVHIAGMELPATAIREGNVERVDLTLLSVDEQKLPVYLRMRRMPLCDNKPWPGEPVIVAIPEGTARSHIMLPSLLPPRPHPIALNEAFAERISPLSRRHKVKPGITGWAQVHGHRGETDTIEKMRRRIECDLYYIDNWSFLLDIKIIVMTLFSRRAYTNAV
jgi:hypothetical protein